MSAGKGDKPRPVNRKRYDANYAEIRWKSASERPSSDAGKRVPSGKARR